nr:TetR/AcrR family transcriptional regulator [Bacilli bacterium]
MPSAQFLQLPKTKQEQIIEASLMEFANYGYDLASTNRIVARAEISKGVLFKYFKDKESLFLYVCDGHLRDYMDSIPRGPFDDIIAFLRASTLHKMRFMHAHPLTYQLFVRILKDAKHPVYAKVIVSQLSYVYQFTEDLQSIVNQVALRDGIAWEHIMNFITWIGLGLQEKYMSSIPDMVDNRLESSLQPMIDELQIYLDLLQFGMYKEGFKP